MKTAARTRDAEPVAETVQFPLSPSRQMSGRQTSPTPDDSATLAAIERRLGQLVQTARLAVFVAAAWLLWSMFGDGFAWLMSAATWTAGVLVLLAVSLGVGMYVSPRFRRAILGGVRGLGVRAFRAMDRRR
ncbi:hypothetical protein [Alienimonas chondri]|uniref:Uncharacterized protein n=1 Tax=Alienimonas chondri TaxID=2681879 RepID=A0ABX1V8B1_9PLAN|nr:hypothetical protein [Alienimonas chondri]NNJ24403.1 hypothetical protein [Alienimonas chondri]